MPTLELPDGYCRAVALQNCNPIHFPYHDTEYGFPVNNPDPRATDNILFERLLLEINQAGLSWETILKKRETFRSAYHQFDIPTVATYQQTDIDRLLSDPGIIRNRLKVNAAISNAKAVLALQDEHGSFKAWLNKLSENECGLDLPTWVKTFKKTFRFTGGEITHSFLMSTGYLPGAHHPNCPIYAQVLPHAPKWSTFGPRP